MIDLIGELRAAGLAPDVLESLMERAAERAVRKVMEEREADRIYDTTALAKRLGISSTKALNARLARGSLAELAAVAFILDGKKHWHRRDVDAVLARVPMRRLRAVGEP